ncbi:hypothetical protein O181_012129 [Austropuccinia psidii MF-1]|uniref:Uncharacterized protein n=1 Tax=Austropuccinia psidii MF-1 TaxID=1389203 RepID=A0A9Q3BVT5_9BASI|nr:hypothetical protein [Austropuccinia psidii MF-1]
MEKKRFSIESHWEKLEASCQKICLKEISFRDLMVITKGWKLTRQFRLLDERATRIGENQATIQAIEEKLNQTGNTLIPSGSQGVDQTNSAVASHHSGTSRYQWPRVTILHNPRYFPGEDKDKREKTRHLSAKGRKSQTQ